MKFIAHVTSLSTARRAEQGRFPQWDTCHSRQGNFETIDFLDEIKAGEMPELRYNSNQPAWTGLWSIPSTPGATIFSVVSLY
jgi:hypothetical protein